MKQLPEVPGHQGAVLRGSLHQGGSCSQGRILPCSAHSRSKFNSFKLEGKQTDKQKNLSPKTIFLHFNELTGSSKSHYVLITYSFNFVMISS